MKKRTIPLIIATTLILTLLVVTAVESSHVTDETAAVSVNPATSDQSEIVGIETIASQPNICRDLPCGSQSSWEYIPVTLNVTVDGANWYLIDEVVPAGLTVADAGGADTSEEGHLKWAVTTGATNTTYTYLVYGPVGLYTFKGKFQMQGMSAPADIDCDTQLAIEILDVPPDPRIIAPSDGATITGTVTVIVIDSSCDTDTPYCLIEYLGDGTSGVIINDTTIPYRGNWNTTTVPDGDYTIRATMVDPAGHNGTDEITVVVAKVLCGDVAPYPNGNGVVDMDDVTLLLSHVGCPEMYPVSKLVGDVNCDGRIDMGDVILLLNYVEDPAEYPLGCCDV